MSTRTVTLELWERHSQNTGNNIFMRTMRVKAGLVTCKAIHKYLSMPPRSPPEQKLANAILR